MRILQVTNLVSHHQLPIARHLVSMVGEKNFRFAALEPPNAERLRLGWGASDTNPWVLRVAENHDDKQQFERWWDEADIVLCGERRFGRMADRLHRGKHCLYMSERWWKPPIGSLRLLSPRFLLMTMQFRKIADDPNFHYLAIGPFAVKDISKIVKLENRIWQWGYFPSTFSKQECATLPTTTFRILWAGRMLDWKRIDNLIKACALLQKEGVPVELTLVGDGPQLRALKNLAARILRPGNYSFIQPLPAHEVPRLMSEHHVYVLPSSSYEGWGAVINEAMACGRAVVASAKAGAAAAMINHGVNGLLFQPGDWRALAAQLSSIASDRVLLTSLGQAALRTIEEVWSPCVAAERLIEFGNSLLERRRPPLYESGPLAPATSWLNNKY